MVVADEFVNTPSRQKAMLADLKIDGEFIRNLALNPVDQLVVHAIVGIAHGMNKKTIAEFVGNANTA